MEDWQESVWRRAWLDSERFRATPLWFWGVEVLVALIGGGIGFYWFTNAKSSQLAQVVFPGLGVFIGLISAYALILAFNLSLAPYRQRNSIRENARIQISQLDSRIAAHEAAREAKLEVEPIIRDENPAAPAARYACVRVSNTGEERIRRCIGRLKSVSTVGPNGVPLTDIHATHLAWSSRENVDGKEATFSGEAILDVAAIEESDGTGFRLVVFDHQHRHLYRLYRDRTYYITIQIDAENSAGWEVVYELFSHFREDVKSVGIRGDAEVFRFVPSDDGRLALVEFTETSRQPIPRREVAR